MSQGAQVQGTGTYTQGTNAPAFADERRQYTQAMWDQMQPQHARQEEGTRTMLANQGLTPGSEAYNRELERLGQAQAGERWNAVQAGGQEQQRTGDRYFEFCSFHRVTRTLEESLMEKVRSALIQDDVPSHDQ